MTDPEKTKHRSSADGNLIFVRHAGAMDYPGNPSESPGPGYYELPGPALSEEGVKQAETLRRFLTSWHVDMCYYSPFKRAQQTAAIVFGDSSVLQEASEWREFGPGETWNELTRRVNSWLDEHMPSERETYAVVTHAEPIRAALEILAPDSLLHAKPDERGLIIPEAGAWLVRRRSNRVIDSHLLQQ